MKSKKTNTGILVIDVGGSHLKLLCTGQTEPIKLPSGPKMSAAKMVAAVKKAAVDCKYSAVTVGYPGPVLHNQVVVEPHNLGRGWVGFNFEKAFGCPVKVINDAAMQALGSYEGGRMLFLGLGTGLGSAMIVNGILEPMELAHLPYKKGRSYEDYVGQRALDRMGKKRWRKAVMDVIDRLKTALEAEYVVLGGGNARLIEKWPDTVKPGSNANAFLGGFRLWGETPKKLADSVDSVAVKKKADKKSSKKSKKKKKAAHKKITAATSPTELEAVVQ